jgi:hypothetical protein
LPDYGQSARGERMSHAHRVRLFATPHPVLLHDLARYYAAYDRLIRHWRSRLGETLEPTTSSVIPDKSSVQTDLRVPAAPVNGLSRGTPKGSKSSGYRHSSASPTRVQLATSAGTTRRFAQQCAARPLSTVSDPSCRYPKELLDTSRGNRVEGRCRCRRLLAKESAFPGPLSLWEDGDWLAERISRFRSTSCRARRSKRNVSKSHPAVSVSMFAIASRM